MIHFKNKTKPKPRQKPPSCIKDFESTTLPLSKDKLIPPIKRSWFTAKLYKIVAQTFPLEGLTPLDYGQTQSSNFLKIKWFDREQVLDIFDKIENRDNSDTEDIDIDDSDEDSNNDSEI